MVKARFIGDKANNSYQCPEFNAGKGNLVSMPNARWQEIVSSGKSGLFKKLKEDKANFPVQRTIG